MGLNSQQFLEEIQTPTKNFTKKQLQEREEFWRALWSWIDDEVKRFILRPGTMVRIMGRDYKGKVGELGAVKFEPREIEVIVYERAYNYNDGKYYHEKKTIPYPGSAIAWYELISESELVEEEREPEIIQEEMGVL